MKRSESIASLAAALAKAQGQMKGAVKDSENPHFRSKYADLASVWDACREALSSNELSIVQAPGDCVVGDSGTAYMTLTTILMHSSGEFIEETMTMPAAQASPHGIGSALTYQRRYALQSFAGIAPEDDDGNAASTAPAPERTRPERVKLDPIGKLRGEAAILLQELVRDKLLEQKYTTPGDAGHFAREELRRGLMGDVPFNKDDAASWKAWLAALRKFREDNTEAQ